MVCVCEREKEREKESKNEKNEGSACLFSSLNTRVTVRGLSLPGGWPFAIFIVGKAATVKSNWTL